MLLNLPRELLNIITDYLSYSELVTFISCSKVVKNKLEYKLHKMRTNISEKLLFLRRVTYFLAQKYLKTVYIDFTLFKTSDFCNSIKFLYSPTESTESDLKNKLDIKCQDYVNYVMEDYWAMTPIFILDLESQFPDHLISEIHIVNINTNGFLRDALIHQYDLSDTRMNIEKFNRRLFKLVYIISDQSEMTWGNVLKGIFCLKSGKTETEHETVDKIQLKLNLKKNILYINISFIVK